MHLTATEQDAVLGYLLFALAIGALAVLAVLADPETAARRHRNRTLRHARRGCEVCTLRLAAEGQYGPRFADLAGRIAAAEAEVDAWAANFPTAYLNRRTAITATEENPAS